MQVLTTLGVDTSAVAEHPGTPTTPTTSSLSTPLSAVEGAFPSSKNNGAIADLDLSDKEAERMLAIRRFLDVNPDTYVPDSRTFLKKQSDLMQHISRSISKLFEASGGGDFPGSGGHLALDTKLRPKLGKALSTATAFELLIHVFGAGSIDDINKRAAATSMTIIDFLRCIVACAVSDWVLEGRDIKLSGHLEDKSAISRIYESQMMECEFTQ